METMLHASRRRSRWSVGTTRSRRAAGTFSANSFAVLSAARALTGAREPQFPISSAFRVASRAFKNAVPNANALQSPAMHLFKVRGSYRGGWHLYA